MDPHLNRLCGRNNEPIHSIFNSIPYTLEQVKNGYDYIIRGNDVHEKGLSSEKVCVPCAVNDTGISYAKPGKLGKISSACITSTFEEKIAPHSVLCTDKERA